MKLAIVTTLWKRHALERISLIRWRAALAELEARGIHGEIVATGSEGEVSAELAAGAGAHYLEHANLPLSEKWNACYRKARELEPDVVMIMGSDDWITTDAIERLSRDALEHGYSALADMYMHCLIRGITAHFPGYGRDSRHVADTIGAGRTLRKDVLDRVNWKFFPRDRNRALDHDMTLVLRNAKAPAAVISAKQCLLDVKGFGGLTKFDAILPRRGVPVSELDHYIGRGVSADLLRLRGSAAAARALDPPRAPGRRSTPR